MNERPRPEPIEREEYVWGEEGIYFVGAEFGITVKHVRDDWNSVDDWSVVLPHSCDEWVISSSDTTKGSFDQASKFHSELSAALDILWRLR